MKTPLEGLVDDFLVDCRARGLKLKTINSAYAWALKSVFLLWCKQQGLTEPGQITSRILNRWTSDLHDQGGKRGKLSPHTIGTYINSVNRFLAWAGREGEMVKLQAQRPKLPQRTLDVLTASEVARMLDKADNDRDRLILRILWETGCRASELLNLRTGDLIERNRQFLLRIEGPSYGGGAKGDRGRLVPIPRLYRELKRYADRRRPEDTHTDRIFIGRRRERSGHYEPLQLSGLEQMIRSLAAEANIGRRVYVHLIRHSAITQMLRKGMSPLLVAQIAGHTSLSMITRTYAHLDTTDAYEAMVSILVD